MVSHFCSAVFGCILAVKLGLRMWNNHVLSYPEEVKDLQVSHIIDLIIGGLTKEKNLRQGDIFLMCRDHRT